MHGLQERHICECFRICRSMIRLERMLSGRQDVTKSTTGKKVNKPLSVGYMSSSFTGTIVEDDVYIGDLKVTGQQFGALNLTIYA